MRLMTQMTQMTELRERGRVIGLKRLIGRLIEGFCSILGAGIVHSCCRILLGSVDIRRVEEGISIEVSSSSFGLVFKPSFAALLVVP